MKGSPHCSNLEFHLICQCTLLDPLDYFCINNFPFYRRLPRIPPSLPTSLPMLDNNYHFTFSFFADLCKGSCTPVLPEWFGQSSPQVPSWWRYKPCSNASRSMVLIKGEAHKDNYLWLNAKILTSKCPGFIIRYNYMFG